MSTSPIYGSGGTTLVRYEVERPHLGGRGTASYPRHREYPRSTNYNTGISYEAHPDYLPYDLPPSQRRGLGTPHEEYYQDDYPLSERTMLVSRTGSTRSGQKVYVHSGNLRSYSSPSTFSPGIRTIDVERHGSTMVRRAGPRYTSRPIDLPYNEYDVFDGFGKYAPVTVVPAGRVGARRSYNPVVYNNRPGFAPAFVAAGPCDYDCGGRGPVLVPASRRPSTQRYS